MEIDYHAVASPGLGTYYLLNYWNMEKALRNVVKNVDIVVHANIIPSQQVVALCRKYAVPTVYDYGDHMPESAATYYSWEPLRLLIHSVTNEIVQENLKRSTAIVTRSHGLRSIIAKVVGSKPVHIIPNGVDDNAFKPLPKEKCREKLGLEPDTKYLLYYGSWDNWLEEGPLYAATRALGCKLLVAGMSHSKAQQRRLAQDARDNRLIYLGAIPHKDIPFLVNAADVVVAPYRQLVKNLAVPLKIIEALACATPVLASSIPEFKLWFGDSVRYYNTGDDLPNALEQIFRDYDGIHTLLLRRRDKFAHRFSWDNLVAEYENVLMETIG